MKIAVITDDGKTISQHFGRALHYQVLTIEEGKVVDREMRDKLGHSQFSAVREHPRNMPTNSTAWTRPPIANTPRWLPPLPTARSWFAAEWGWAPTKACAG